MPFLQKKPDMSAFSFDSHRFRVYNMALEYSRDRRVRINFWVKSGVRWSMRKFALMAAFLLVESAMFAASWPSSGPSRQVVTLVVCSNNKSPRLLAELIQVESKQPYLLLPAPQSDDTRIFFIPSKGVAYQIAESKLDAFVRFLNPGRIVVLGNESFVPKRYLEKFDQNIPMFIATCKDWVRISEELAYMLNISGLQSDYKRLRDLMLTDSRFYRPISKPATNSQEPVVEKEEKLPVMDDAESAPAEDEEVVAVEDTAVVEDGAAAVVEDGIVADVPAGDAK